MLIIQHCEQIIPKQRHETAHTDALMVPVGQEYGSSLAGGFGLRVSHELVGKMSVAAKSLKGLD